MIPFIADLNNFFLFIGQIVITILVFILLVSLTASILIIYSFKTNRLLFPNFMLSIIILLEGVVKTILRFMRMDDSIVDRMAIQLKNRLSIGRFKEIPNDKSMIFFPQCLRNINCPSKLTSEGLQCINCGLCQIGNVKKKAEELGYQVFVVPGSSFIKRMVKKYKPVGILGVGCMLEIKNGLDMCSNIGVIGVGVELEKAGCVATELEWEELYKILNIEDD